MSKIYSVNNHYTKLHLFPQFAVYYILPQAIIFLLRKLGKRRAVPCLFCRYEWYLKVQSVGPKKRLILSCNRLVRTRPVVYLWTSLFQSSCQSCILKDIVRLIKNLFRPAATGLLSHHTWDLTHTIFPSFYVPGSSIMLKNWLRYDQKQFCIDILL